MLRATTRPDCLEFEDLYQRYYDPVLAYLLRRVKPRETAEDIAAETFQKAWIAWLAYDHQQKPLNWLFRIAGRALIDHFRHEGRESSPPVVAWPERFTPRAPDPEDTDPSPVLEVTLEAIPKLQRQAVLLELQGYNDEQIARYLSTSEEDLEQRLKNNCNNIRALRFRARESIKKVGLKSNPE
jgi:RNA polymerase sigma-70 factor (ECF subfamily)